MFFMYTHDIAIIGGGASGLAAAITARQTNPSLRIIIFEKNERVGKKLLSTGNGRCNFSNTNMDVKFYHSQTPNFIQQVLRTFGTKDALHFFKRIGLYATDEDGRLYPYSQRAASVLDVLRLSLHNIEIRTNEEISSLKNIPARKIIITTGGKAAPHTGSTGDGICFLKEAGHTIVPPYPALTPLIIKHPVLPSLKGIRIKPCSLTINEASYTGEVLFTEYGLSGIPAMQASGAMANQKEVTAYLDLLPFWTEQEVMAFMNERMNQYLYFSKEDFFTGLFHKRIGQMLLQEIEKSPMILKNFPFKVIGVKNYAHAQVMGGGCRLTEFDPATMQSNKNNNLYAAGEVLDAYGDCGGYNLHWAWATGYLAGRGAALSCVR